AGLRRLADPRQGQGQDDDRSHLAGGAVAPLSRPPRQDQRQHVSGRRERLHRGCRQGREPAHRRRAPALHHDRARPEGARRALGRHRRRELRRRLEPRARGDVAALPRVRRRAREELRPHPRDQSEEARHPAAHGKLRVPAPPLIAFSEGDGTGPDIWRASVRVLDAAVEQAYRGKKKIAWAEVFAGEKAQAVYGRDCPPNLLPEETLDVIREFLVAIKGPLTTPVGEGFRSLNVTLRQVLDLYVCLRPVKYFQ